MPRVFGYARPTFTNPDPKTHATQLSEAGAERLFVETTTGRAPRSMKARRELFQELRSKDTLIVPGLDRLGFNIDDILRSLAGLVEKDVNVRLLDAEIETEGSGRDGYRSLLAAIKTASSALHSEQAKVDIARAKARGGNPAGGRAKLTDDMWPDVRARLKTTKVKVLAHELGVARQTLWNFRRRCQRLATPPVGPEQRISAKP
ncbi:recombinase family protein [Sphingomonas sp. CARO-RG-8B-R24-01]|uniref:recombinase family protein n=1 Tax=Sphingomonas sp. CARO-RG-8B-R24-01 TaxID=2914831 RepID=UPI001F58D66C|nr:recombinase family protein [Sphingomonas sp. CARO-RG-8B-R24-01]